MKKIWIGGEEDFGKVMLWAAVTTALFFPFAGLEQLPFQKEKPMTPMPTYHMRKISVDNSQDPSIVSLFDQARDQIVSPRVDVSA